MFHVSRLDIMFHASRLKRSNVSCFTMLMIGSIPRNGLYLENSCSNVAAVSMEQW